MKIKIDKLDKEFSLYIRAKAKWKCARCGKDYSKAEGRERSALHASHFWGRANRSTRWDEENIDPHCYGCHSYLGANPEAFRAWKLERLGEEKYKALMQRANSIKKWTEKEKQELYEYYKKQNKNLQ